jgi:superfamily II DNA or RNA helicase
MMDLLPGTEVQARGLRWEVVLTESLGQQRLYRLRALEGALQGREVDLLHPFEQITPVLHDFQPERAAPLRNWLVYHQAFLLEQQLGPDALVAVQPGRLELQPYQLVPVLRAIRMSRVRLLLADSVGLGKTVQAGLVLTELVARRLAHRILVVSPAGPLLEQWRTEMRERFGLRLDVVDRARLEEIRRGTELGTNPFDHIPLGLVSIDFLKQERVLDQLERSIYDVVVIDEAHHCTDLGAAEERDDSQRRRLAEVLARRCDSMLLLTATPHDGNDRSFASLCELLDPSLVDGHGSLRGERYQEHVVRRLKRHVKNPKTGEPLFRERVVYPIPVVVVPDRHAAFMQLQRELLELIAPELRRAFRARRYDDVLSFIALLKRSVSTVEACRTTLATVADRFQKLLTDEAESQESRRERLRTLREAQRKRDRFGTASQEEEAERELLEAEDMAQQLASVQRDVRSGSRRLTKRATVVEALDVLIELATAAAAVDPKLEQLVAEIAAIRRGEPHANILVYSEYVTSQAAAVAALKALKVGTVITMSGEDDDATRTAVTERFRKEDGVVLVSTDAAAEGLNLQERCHHLIHLELPFNPNRLEQRNGRIDRYGQQKDPIVRYLFLRGTFEERILLRLIAKYERQRARLTFVPNTLGITTSTDAAAERLLKGLLDEEATLFKSDTPLFKFASDDEAEGAPEATKELLEEIDRSLKSFEDAARTHAWLGDAGLNAEERLLNEAGQAFDSGQKAGSVDLADFVVDAARLDGGDLAGKLTDPVFALTLPPAWSHGLEDLPGYDAASRCVRLTTRIEVTSDDKDRPVGYLGRSHPLVRRALDRVRHLSFGGDASTPLDVRVSAVSAYLKEPTLLYTFLGRVSSEAGREMERVLAVLVPCRESARFVDSPEQWLSLAERQRAIATRDVWKKNFASWANGTEDQARATAKEGFRPFGASFVEERRRLLEAERAEQADWLGKRAGEITGASTNTARQREFFRPEEGAEREVPTWVALADPAELLAAFVNDSSQHPAHRSEADGVLRVYRQRMAILDSRLRFGAPEVVPLGLLMLVPEGRRGA